MPRAAPEPVAPGAPRLAPDVPFPRYAFVPGETPHPRRAPDGHSHGRPLPAPGLDAGRWREDTTWLAAIDLYHAGYLWEAHEAFEAVFFAAPRDSAHRLVVQSLVQLAAAVLQSRRRVGRGVRLLVTAARAKLDRAAATTDGRIAGLDPRAVARDVGRHFAAALDPRVADADAWRTNGAAPRLDLSDRPGA